MSVTGNLQGSVNVSIDSLNELIVFANKYRSEVDSIANEIKAECRKMEENESLRGGDGDEIRESFKTISVACTSLFESTSYISSKLNEKLKVALDAAKGKTSSAASESIHKASKQTGVLKR